MYPDGGNLYLYIGRTGAKSWMFRYRWEGSRHDMGLGPFPAISLAEAREKASAQRRLLLEKINPLTDARRSRQGSLFADVSDRCIDSLSQGWHGSRRRQSDQWRQSLRDHAYPIIGDMDVRDIGRDHLLAVLQPIWATKNRTANRVRARIEAVLNYAMTAGLREQGLNPARWRGHLSNLLAPPSRVQQVAHHAALPYAELPAFMAELRKNESLIARALEFTILTATRTGEVLLASWDEIDMANKLWTIPAARMKGGREHRVPLSDRALAIVQETRAFDFGQYVFPGRREEQPLNAAGLYTWLRRTRPGLTVHGFRSSFRDWATDLSGHSFEVAEMALAHTVGDRTARAYARSDLLDRRRELMQAWARYCAGDE
jgi:integrase